MTRRPMVVSGGEGSGASVPDQALAVPATPANAVDGPPGFDPSRIAVHMRNGRVHERDTTWCGKKLLGQPDCDGDGIETFNVYGSNVRTTYDEPFVTCQRCLDEFETSYRRAFPDGPKPIATIYADNPNAKELLGPETMARFFGPNGEGATAYEEFVAALATEAGTAETTEIGSAGGEGAGPKDNAQDESAQ
jgi:hypothetical protein